MTMKKYESVTLVVTGTNGLIYVSWRSGLSELNSTDKGGLCYEITMRLRLKSLYINEALSLRFGVIH